MRHLQLLMWKRKEEGMTVTERLFTSATPLVMSSYFNLTTTIQSRHHLILQMRKQKLEEVK